MSGDLKKPLVVAVVCAVLAIVVFGLGVGVGTRDRNGDGGWHERLAGLGVGRELVAADLKPTGGSCEFTEDSGGNAAADLSAGIPTLTVESACTVTVEAFGSRFSLETTKAGGLVAVDPVRARLQVEGVESGQDLAAGCEVELVFGRSGGRLLLECAGLGPCRVQLARGNECS